MKIVDNKKTQNLNPQITPASEYHDFFSVSSESDVEVTGNLHYLESSPESDELQPQDSPKTVFTALERAEYYQFEYVKLQIALKSKQQELDDLTLKFDKEVKLNEELNDKIKCYEAEKFGFINDY